LATSDLSRFVALSAALAILTGAMLALLGFFRLGFVSQFLAVSVQTGFMFGLGMTITVGQIPKVLGLSAVEGDFFPSLWHVLTHLDETNAWTAAIGLGSLAALLLLRRLAPRLPAALLVVAVSIVVTAALGLAARGVAIVGAIPAGLPMPALPAVGLRDIIALLPAALGLAVIGYAESASVAQGFATRHHYEIEPDRELVAVGVANGLAGLFQGFMVGGGASQSAANDQAGARSQAASLIVAALALVTAFFLTPLFFDLPQAALGAIVINAVLGFFQVGELQRFARLRRDSFWLALVTLACVLALGVLPGLLSAIVLSLILVLVRAARPGAAVLGRAPDAPVYGDLERNPDYRPIPGLLIVRLNAPLVFVNARRTRDQVMALARTTTPPPRAVLLNLEMTPGLDIESADTLTEVRAELASAGIDLRLAGVHGNVRDMLVRSGYIDPTDEVTVFPDIETAVTAFELRRGGVDR
jgi:high affinity sulfate transporter 1